MDVQLAKKFAEILEKRVKEYYMNFSPDKWQIFEPDWQVKVKPGKNYIKIDVQRSGKFMMDSDNKLYYIKGYGVIDKKKYFGKVDAIVNNPDKWWFDGHSIAPKGKRTSYGYAGIIAEERNKMKKSELRSLIKEQLLKELSKEEFLNLPEPEIVDSLIAIGMNERKFYEKRDVKGAIAFAKQQYLKDVMQNLKDDINSAAPKAEKELAKYWRKDDEM